MSDVPGYAPDPDFIGQIVQGEQAGTAAGTAMGANLIAGATAGANIAQTRAQTAGIQQANAMQALRIQFMQSQMSYASHVIAGMNSGPINDDGSSSAVGSAQAAALDNADASGDTPGAAGAVTPPNPSAAPTGVSSNAIPGAASAAGASLATATTSPGAGQSAAGAPLTLADVNLDPGHIDASTQRRYGVFGIMTPQEYGQLQNARAMDMSSAAVGMPTQYAAQVQANIEQRIRQQTAQATAASSEMYDRLTDSVVNAPPGTAFQAMQGFSPSDGGGKAMADRLQAVAKSEGWTDQQLDQVARTVASEAANSMFRYTNRPTVTGDDGVTRDKSTTQPITGARTVGVAPNTIVQAAGRAAGSGAQLVAVPDGMGGTNQVPLWKANGFQSLEDFKRASGIPATPGMAAPPTPGAAPGATAPGGNPQQRALVAQTMTAGNPQLRQMLSDPQYAWRQPSTTPGTTLNPTQASVAEEYGKKEIPAFYDDQRSLVDSSSQSMQYIRAAQQLMQSGGNFTGAYAGLKQTLSRWLPGQSIDASNYQQFAKQIGNLAVQNFRQNFGARPANAEFQIQMNQLNPSASMTPQAISSLLDENSRIAQYGLDTAHRMTAWDPMKQDVRKFWDANQEYFPREQYVSPTPQGGNSSAAQTPRGPAVGTVSRGYRYVGGDPGNRASWSPVQTGATGSY